MGRAECVDCGAVLREMLVEGKSVMVCPWKRGAYTRDAMQPCRWPMSRQRETQIRRDW